MGGSLILKGVSGEQLSEIVGKAYPVRIIAGSIDLVAKGKYEGANGLTSRISLTGRDIALSGENRRTIFSGGKLDISADLAKRDLLIREAVVTVGEKLKVGLKGTLKNVTVPERVGNFSLELPGIEIASILDIFANALPPFLQEAEAKGSVRIKSEIKTWGKGGEINGEIEIEDGGLDIPSQKLTVTGVKGTVPFETVLKGSPPQQWDKGRVKRDNYREMLSLLKSASSEGYNLVIERIRFGAAEFTDTRFSIGTGNGVTEVKSLTSRLFHGEILGRGSFSLSDGDRFGGDILVHDLSLQELCDSYPAIRGYMTGRVNGFVSLFAAGRGLTALKGLMEFWARSAAGEKMLISKDFLQKLSGKKLKGVFFQNDRPYDRGEIAAYLEDGYLTFQTMDISHTNLLGMRDLSVAVAPVQNKISLEHLLATIREAASRGKAATRGGGSEPSPPGMEFKWEE